MDRRQKRGTLISWDQQYRIGFIMPEGGTEALRIKGINLYPYAHAPQVGDILVYRMWKDSFTDMKVLVAEVDLGNPIKLISPFASDTSSYANEPLSWRIKLSIVACIAVFASILYVVMSSYQFAPENTNKPPEGLFPAGSEYYVGKRDLSDVVFSCDSRRQCLQMTSCQEATYFVQHCPGFEKLVGEMPCEKLWCK